MKQFILINAMLFSLNVQADLVERARQEKSWRPIEIRIASMSQPAATGYLTGAGTWRLERIAPELEVRTDLTSDYAAGLGLAQFTKHCGRMGYGFATVRELNRPHKLKLRLPDWAGAVDGADGPQPMRILKVRSKVAFEASSYTLRYGNIDPRHLGRDIESQVQARSGELLLNGAVEIDVSGHDYVACDFVAGQIHIGLEVVWEYPSAKLRRTATLAHEDLTKAIERARAGFTGGMSCDDNLVLASAIFATSLNSVTGKGITEIGRPNYVATFNTVYDRSACRWRDERSVDVNEIAQGFDLLSEGKTQSSTRILSKFSGVIQ